MSCFDLEQYEAFTCIGNNKVHILVPRSRVAKAMLLFATFFLLFFILVELIIISGEVPWPVRLMPAPVLVGSIISFGLWRKWHKTGQVVEIDEGSGKLIIEERKANIIPSCRTISIKDIGGFSVIPFVVYRIQSRSGTRSTAHTKGFCVSVVFPAQKLFWFIQKNTPKVTIGGYLTRNEAVALRQWLTKNTELLKTDELRQL